MKLTLFSGKDCHLCDVAKALIHELEQESAIELEIIDIKSNHDFYHLYAVRIPVLKRMDNQMELGWPFDLQQLREFIR
ncbi:MAG: glutaredoxin family protein [Aliiglaciecola sp.]